MTFSATVSCDILALLDYVIQKSDTDVNPLKRAWLVVRRYYKGRFGVTHLLVHKTMEELSAYVPGCSSSVLPIANALLLIIVDIDAYRCDPLVTATPDIFKALAPYPDKLAKAKVLLERQ